MAPVAALPTLRSHPRCPPRWGLHGACFLRARSCCPSRTLSPLSPHLAALSSGGGGAVRPSLPSSPTLGGAEVCGGGGGPCRHPFVARMSQARRKHGAGTRRGTCPCAGGGGMPCGSRRRPSYPAFAPPVVPPLGLARRVLSTGTVVWSVPHPLAAASPPCRFVLGGRGAFRPPLPASSTLGGAEVCVWGGGGALVVFPPQHARRRHDASMAQARGAALVPLQGGGGLPCVTCRRPSYPACAPPGGEVCVGGGGGALVVVPSLHACRRHDASTTQARGGALGWDQSRFQAAHGARHDTWQLSPTLPPLLPPSPSVLAWCRAKPLSPSSLPLSAPVVRPSLTS